MEPSAIGSANHAGTHIRYPFDANESGQDLSFLIRSFVVDPQHAIVANWPSVSRKIIDLINHAGLAWAAVECFERRPLDAKPNRCGDDTTVVISVSEVPVKEEVEELLREVHKLSGGLFVDLVQGKVELLRENPDNRIERPESLSNQQEDIGESRVGLQYGLSFVELYGIDGVLPRVYALACCHSVAPNDSSSEPYVFQPETLNTALTRIFISSSCDDPQSPVRYEDALREVLMEQEAELKQKVETTTEVDEQSLDVAVWALERTRYFLSLGGADLIASFASYDEIAFVCARSCCRVSTGKHALDWALLEFYDEPFSKTALRNCLSFLSGMGETVKDTAFCRRNAEISGNVSVYKYGATAALTFGVTNNVLSCVNSVRLQHGPWTEEWAVVPSCGEEAFARKDDSGSLVRIEGCGSALGMVWAGSKATNTCYVTPLLDVATDIEEVTGCKIGFLDGDKIR